MKYSSPIILCLLLLPFLSLAQDNYYRQPTYTRGNIKLGFTLSPNVGWMRVTNGQNSNLSPDGARAGFSYGCTWRFWF